MPTCLFRAVRPRSTRERRRMQMAIPWADSCLPISSDGATYNLPASSSSNAGQSGVSFGSLRAPFSVYGYLLLQAAIKNSNGFFHENRSGLPFGHGTEISLQFQ